MDVPDLLKILNALAARSVVLECQILALRRILHTEGIVDDSRFEAMLEQAVAAYKEVLSPEQGEQERLAEFLRKFEGPVQ